MASPPLDLLQRWMQSVLSHPGGVVAGSQAATNEDWTISEVITPSQRLSAPDRLAIYGHAYYARLLECLRSEFPAVHRAAGDEAFSGLAAAYLQSYPSRSYTLAELGRHFSDSLHQSRPPRASENPLPDYADFLIDLARLERCYSEVFDGPGPERMPGLTPEALAALPPERFADAQLMFHDSVRLLELRFPCHEYASAVRQGRDPVPPPPEPTSLVVYRKNYVVRRFAATPIEFALLSDLRRGSSIAETMHHAAALGENAGPFVRQCFAAWTAAPLFREVLAN